MFILMISKKYNIDESHDISHSMEMLHFANDIYMNNNSNDQQRCASASIFCEDPFSSSTSTPYALC